MVNNKQYWVNKEERAEKAKNHTVYMSNMYKDNIENSIKNTVEYSYYNSVHTTTKPNINISLVDTDTVSAVIDVSIKTLKKTCVLNFASYKNPGGKFLEGSKAQEECICHESTLYNVLSHFTDYYSYNKKNLNKALYTNRALYTPDISFKRDNYFISADVLTCAAPNYTAANKYCNISRSVNSTVLRDRIKFVLSIINSYDVDNIILGAYGCGVFGQDPTEVATIFKEEIDNIISKDVNIIFAIIDKDSDNYKAFEKVLCS